MCSFDTPCGGTLYRDQAFDMDLYHMTDGGLGIARYSCINGHSFYHQEGPAPVILPQARCHYCNQPVERGTSKVGRRVHNACRYKRDAVVLCELCLEPIPHVKGEGRRPPHHPTCLEVLQKPLRSDRAVRV